MKRRVRVPGAVSRSSSKVGTSSRHSGKYTDAAKEKLLVRKCLQWLFVVTMIMSFTLVYHQKMLISNFDHVSSEPQQRSDWEGKGVNNNDNNNKNIFGGLHPFMGQQQQQQELARTTMAEGTDVPVLSFDRHVLRNIQATYQGGWSTTTYPEYADNTEPRFQFKSAPLSATVDRRPLIIRKQLMSMKNDDNKQNEQQQNQDNPENLLGCAISSVTYVSDIEKIDIKKGRRNPTCHVCIQFSNLYDMHRFLPDVEHHLPSPTMASDESTKCFAGYAEVENPFYFMWQQKSAKEEGFVDFGYPITLDCQLPSGIQELTCRDLSKLQQQIPIRDDVLNIYFTTTFSLDAVANSSKQQSEMGLTFNTTSHWPWEAVMSHDDDRSRIAKRMGKFWNDVSPVDSFIPSSVETMKFARVEGPGFHQTKYSTNSSAVDLKIKMTLQSMNMDETSNGGLHQRLPISLFHAIRNSPGSTQIIAVLHGQAMRSYGQLQRMLAMKVTEVFSPYGHSVYRLAVEAGTSMDLIPIDRIIQYQRVEKYNEDDLLANVTLRDLLSARNIRIHLTPYIAPAISALNTVCGEQYGFATYLAARYAADFDAILFGDGDTVFLEAPSKNESIPSTFFNKLFSNSSPKCVGHRIQMYEQHVPPKDEKTLSRVLQCSNDVRNDPEKWRYTIENCQLAKGNIVARTDSVLAFYVHQPFTLDEYITPGLHNCKGQRHYSEYMIKESDIVQVHLRNRMRKEECSCFFDQNTSSSSSSEVFLEAEREPTVEGMHSHV